VYAGWNVPLDYDPMLAKLIVWHETRELAILRMLRALGEYHIGGIESNLSLFRTVLNDAAFRAGELDTGYLDRLLRERLLVAAPPRELAPLAALAIQTASKATEESKPRASGSRWLAEGRAMRMDGG
jgi:acetyl-CoA carboxylase biotin carboxylase subunit